MQLISYDAFEDWASRQSPLLCERAFFNDAAAFDEERVHFHQGDLETDTLMVAPVTVIDGNLTVRKIDYAYDTGLLVVSGNVVCQHLGRMHIDVVIGGDLRAKTLCLNTLNDYSLFVGGDLHAGFLSEHGAHVDVRGKIVCPTVLSLMNEIVAHGGVQGRFIHAVRGRNVGQVLIDAVLTPEGYLDEEKLEACVLGGASPLKS
ncbi:hypothetical protein INH39_19010 [Massilia violaceinigra]|uniref:Cell shape determination protein CcmA n=1 Tax=Massilia violaceinigra TaxID=2045208 RepID=A0ABY4A1L0_9BURK|nr:hypothetical protein [Massilia violaceinigra]UOD27599.1 hypothetical protein INH39_19010 [Massilia violaceinigra]